MRPSVAAALLVALSLSLLVQPTWQQAAATAEGGAKVKSKEVEFAPEADLINGNDDIDPQGGCAPPTPGGRDRDAHAHQVVPEGRTGVAAAGCAGRGNRERAGTCMHACGGGACRCPRAAGMPIWPRGAAVSVPAGACVAEIKQYCSSIVAGHGALGDCINDHIDESETPDAASDGASHDGGGRAGRRGGGACIGCQGHQRGTARLRRVRALWGQWQLHFGKLGLGGSTRGGWGKVMQAGE